MINVNENSNIINNSAVESNNKLNNLIEEYRRENDRCSKRINDLQRKLNATAKYYHGTEFVEEFNTVIYAIGRDAVHGKDLAEGCGRGAQPQEREAAAQQAGAVRRCAGRQARADPRGHPGGQAAGQAAG